jgi:hypothetical protein
VTEIDQFDTRPWHGHHEDWLCDVCDVCDAADAAKVDLPAVGEDWPESDES